MPPSSFDFDVITGPSVPRDGREQPQGRDPSPTQPAGTQPAAPRTR